MKEENHSKVESVINAERRSYLFRLRKKSFQGLELSKCKTTVEVFQVTRDIEESQRLQRLSECVKTFRDLQNPKELEHGIPIVQDDVGLITEQDLKDAGHVDNLGDYSQVLRRELRSSVLYNEYGFEITQESIDSKLQEIQDELDVDDEKRSFNHVSGFEKYKEKIENGDFADIFISGMQLPGNGMSYKSCMMYQIKGCTEISHQEEYGIYQDQVKRVLKKCNRLSCPKCWSFAINKQALSAVDRIEATLSFKKNRLWMENKQSRIYNHLVVSVPKSEYYKFETHESRLKAERYIFKKLKSIGIEGGAVVYHPFRFSKNIKRVRFSPHLHILGFGYTDKDEISVLYQKTGLFVKSINTFNDSKTAFTTVRYLLSHTGVSENKHRIKYFGQAGNNKFSTSTILAKSTSSIDYISYHVSSWRMLRHQSRGMSEDVPLQHVSLSLASYQDESNIKSLREIDSDSFDLSTCTINDVAKRIYEMIHHIDNPAKAKSTTFNDEQQQTPPHQFLHVRRAYSIEKSKTIYRYETLIISFDESQICPICSRKLRLIEPIDRGETNVVDLPLDEIVSVDCEIYRYVENFSDPRGQMYFDEDGVMCYDDGVPISGPYHELLPDSVKLIHDKMIHRCKVKASIRLETGKTPTNKEIDEAISTQQSISEPLEWHKTFPASEKITKWFDDSLHLSDGKRG